MKDIRICGKAFDLTNKKRAFCVDLCLRVFVGTQNVPHTIRKLNGQAAT